MLGYKSKDELMSIDIKKELYISEDERPDLIKGIKYLKQGSGKKTGA